MIHNINLNIHYTMPKDLWKKLDEVYSSMPYWAGYCVGEQNVPCWKGDNIDLEASVEPSGIQISGEMPEEIWESWLAELKNKLTEALGYEIGEPEEGYDFKYWE